MVKNNIIKVLRITMLIMLIIHEFVIVKNGIRGYLNFIDIYRDSFNRGLGIFLIYMFPFLLELSVLIILTIGLIKSLKNRRGKREIMLLFLNCILWQVGFYVAPFIAAGIVFFISYLSVVYTRVKRQ